MKYNPKDAMQCLPEGEYEAALIGCDDKPSKSGKEMWTITLEVYPPNGSNVQIKDYIVNPETLWKARGLAKALNAADVFNAGTFDPSNYLQSNIRLVLKVESDDDYGDKNIVKKYLPSTLATQPAAKKPAKSVAPTKITEDDIPF